MGYRYYMYAISREKLKEIEELTYDEFMERFREDEDSDIVEMHSIPDRTLYGFGEMNKDLVESIRAKGVRMFRNEKIQDELDYYKPYVMGKDGLLEAIKWYKEATIKLYKGLLEDDSDREFFPKTSKEKMEKHIKGIVSEWEKDLALNISEKSDVITNSWRIEYSLFELTRIYKTFDSKKEVILFYGY